MTSPKPRTEPTRTVRYHRPPVYELQRQFLADTSRYVVVEASTKTGKTVSMLIWLLEQAMQGRPGWNYWWVAPVFVVAKIAFRRLQRWLRTQSAKVGFEFAISNESELTLTLANGAVIWFKSGEKPDSLYGEDVHAAVLDEASRMKEESWHAVRSTLTATAGPARIIGNVKGRKNWAHHLARKAEGGEPDMAFYRLTAYDAADGLAKLKADGLVPESTKVITVEDIEDAKRQLPRHVFDELYLAIPSDDGSNPFGLEHIRRQVAPLSPGPLAVSGADLAKSVDWTVVIGLDGAGNTCRYERWQAPWETTEGRLLAAFEGKPALVDSTGVGDPIVERIRKKAPVEGFKFTPLSKQQLMEGLAAAIQQGRVTYPDGVIVSELESFEFVYTRTGVLYSAPPGLHDDTVMALALAVRKLTRGSGHVWLEAWDRMGGEDKRAAIARDPSQGRVTPEEIAS